MCLTSAVNRAGNAVNQRRNDRMLHRIISKPSFRASGCDAEGVWYSIDGARVRRYSGTNKYKVADFVAWHTARRRERRWELMDVAAAYILDQTHTTGLVVVLEQWDLCEIVFTIKHVD